MAQAIREVARHRDAAIRPLAEVLDGYADIGKTRWVQWRRRSNSDHLPEDFTSVLQVVVAFADPVLTADVADGVWEPEIGAWEQKLPSDPELGWFEPQP